MKHVSEFLKDALPDPATQTEPKIQYCVEWIITMKHNPAYCRECIDVWRNSFGESFAEKVAREVRKECSKQKKLNPLDD